MFSTRKFIIFILLFLSLQTILIAQNQRIELTQWRLSCPDPKDTSFVISAGATVPGSLHTDLLNKSLIPHPYEGTNEASLQWLSDVECTYSYDLWRQDIRKWKEPELVLSGVTGYAEVFLNGKPLLHQEGSNVMDNAFRTWRFPLNGKLFVYNLIEVRFTPARRIIEERKAQVPYALPDDRVFLRTPPYQAGWDWGPKLTTCGISGSAAVESNPNPRFLSPVVELSSDNEVTARIAVEAITPAQWKGNVALLLDGDPLTQTSDISGSGVKQIEARTSTRNELWYPNGSGAPTLHDLEIRTSSGKKCDTTHFRTGFRSVKLDRTADSIGSSFTFIVNDEPIFMKGVNWIPASFFPTEMTEERYRELLQACQEAHINMIRVWGGGIYEPDIFYDLCDELGIMVWQDFMFACALYPGDSAFLDNVRQEAIEQVLRLRRHPCIAVWCGNNEVKNGWEDWGWQADYTAEQRATIDHDLHYLFDTLLFDIVREYGAGVPYTSTSPLWGWGHETCCTEGDSHYWGVWWGEQPFEMWYKKTGRFMSEYGFQSYPDIETLQTVIPEDELHLGSPSMNSHQKHGRGVQIINKAMEQYFYRPEELRDYIYISQLVQAFGVGMALEEHRRRMPYCMGTLFWQLNDCWPVASWSCIDYYGRRKALYYEAKRQFEPVIIACDTMRNNTLPIFLVNDQNTPTAGKLTLSLCDFYGNVVRCDSSVAVVCNAHTSNEISQFILPEGEKRTDRFLLITLTDALGKSIAQKPYFFTYPKHLSLPEEEISITRLSDTEFVISSPSLQYGVELRSSCEGHFSDNFFTLLPNQPTKVTFYPKDSSIPSVDIQAKSFNRNRH